MHKSLVTVTVDVKEGIQNDNSYTMFLAVVDPALLNQVSLETQSTVPNRCPEGYNYTFFSNADRKRHIRLMGEICDFNCQRHQTGFNRQQPHIRESLPILKGKFCIVSSNMNKSVKAKLPVYQC